MNSETDGGCELLNPALLQTLFGEISKHKIWLISVKVYTGSAWVAQLVEHPTLDFSSGHDLRVVGSSPESGSMLSRKAA